MLVCWSDNLFELIVAMSNLLSEIDHVLFKFRHVLLQLQKVFADFLASFSPVLVFLTW